MNAKANMSDDPLRAVSAVLKLGRTCVPVALVAGAVLAVRLLDGTPMALIAFVFALCGFLLATLLDSSGHTQYPLQRPQHVGQTGPADLVRLDLVKAALANLDDHAALQASPLARLTGMTRRGAHANELRTVLVDAVSELATSPRARDREAGRLLLDYYVNRVGSHEVVMERLYLSRPTFYRRLKHGLQLVTQHIDELSAEQTCRSPIQARTRRLVMML